MSFADEWEEFYTESKAEDRWLVDIIAIDETKQEFILYIDTPYLAVEGYDENFQPIHVTYVSRFVFDMIVKGIQEKGFVFKRKVLLN